MAVDRRGAARLDRHLVQGGLDGVQAHHDGQVAADGRALAGAAGGGQARHDGEVVAGGLGLHVAARLDRVSVAALDLHLGLAVKHVHVCGQADGLAAAARHRGGDVDHVRAGVGLDGHVALRRLDVLVLAARADGDQALGGGVDHVQGARDGRGLVVRRAGGAGDHGDHLVLRLGIDGDVPARGQRMVLGDVHAGLGLVVHELDGAAGGGALLGRGQAGGDHQQVHGRVGADVDVVAAVERGQLARAVFDLVVQEQYVERAAYGLRLVLVGGVHGRRGVERLHVHVAVGLLVHVPGVDGHAAAHGGLDHVGGAEERDHQARAVLALAGRQRAADQAGVVVAAGLQVHAVDLRLLPGRDRGVVAHHGVDLVVRAHDGHGARQVQLVAIALRRLLHHRARDGFHIVVVAGQEVQHVRDLHQRVGVQVHVHRIGRLAGLAVHVDQAGVDVLALLVVQVGGIADQILPGKRELVVAVGHAQLLRVQREGIGGDVDGAAEVGFHVVAAPDGGGGHAHAGGRALGDVDAARADRQLGLVGGRDADVRALDLAGAPVALFLIADDAGPGGGVADQRADRAGDGLLRLVAGHRAGDGLHGQPALVGVGQVLGQVGVDGHVAAGVDIAVHVDGRLVVVHADAHGGRDAVALVAVLQAHRSGCGAGVEVAGVARGQADALARLQPGAVHLDRRVVQRHGDAHGSRDLQLRAFVLFLFIAAQTLAALLVHDVGGAGGPALRVAALVELGAHRAQRVGGHGQVLAGLAAVFGLHLVVVQAIGDPLAGVVGLLLLVGVLGLLVEDRAGGQAVGQVGDAVCKLGDLVQVALHVRAHRAGEGPGVVHAQAVRAHVDPPRRVHGVAHLGLDVGKRDVQRHARAHRAGGAGGKRAGLRLARADLGRVHHHAAAAHLDGLGLVLADLFLFFVLVLLAVVPGAVVAGGLDHRILRDGGDDVVVQYVQGHGGVDAHVLLGIRVHVHALQRVGARGGVVLLLVVGRGRDGHAARGDAGRVVVLARGVALADGRLHVGIAVGQRERRANAHLAAGAVGILRLLRLLLGGLLRVALLKLLLLAPVVEARGEQQLHLADVRVGHAERQHGLVGVGGYLRHGLRARGHLLILGLQRVAGDDVAVAVVHVHHVGVQLADLRDRDLHQVALLGFADRVAALLALDAVGDLLAGVLELLVVFLVFLVFAAQPLQGRDKRHRRNGAQVLLELDVEADVEVLFLVVVQKLDARALGGDHQVVVAVLLQRHGVDHFVTVGVGVGSNDALVRQLVALLERDVQAAVLTVAELHAAARAAGDHGHHAVLAGDALLRRGAAAGLRVLGVARALVVVGLAVRVHRGGGVRADAARLLGVHYQRAVVGDVDGLGGILAVGNLGLRGQVRHGDGQAARAAGLLRARAGDGLGGDDVPVGDGLALELHVQLAQGLVDHFVGHGDRRFLQQAAQLALQVFGQARLLDPGRQRLVVVDLRAERLRDVRHDAARELLHGRVLQRLDHLEVTGVDDRQLCAERRHHALDGGVDDLAEGGLDRILERVHQRVLLVALALGLVDDHVDHAADQGVLVVRHGAGEYGHGVAADLNERGLPGGLHDVLELLLIHAGHAVHALLHDVPQRRDQRLGEGLEPVPHLVRRVRESAFQSVGLHVEQRFQIQILDQLVVEGGDERAAACDHRLDVRVDVLAHQRTDGLGHLLGQLRLEAARAFDGGDRAHLRGSLGDVRDDLQARRPDAAVAHAGDVVHLHDVQSDAHAHAHVRIGGGGVGLDGGVGPVRGMDGHRALGVDVHVVQYLGAHLVLLHVQHERARAGHGVLGGLGLLAVLRVVHDLAAVHAAVLAGQAARAAQQVVRLLVGAAFLIVPVLVARRAAGGRGSGHGLQRVAATCVDGDVLRALDRLVQLGVHLVADPGDDERAADRRLAARGRCVRGDQMIVLHLRGISVGLDRHLAAHGQIAILDRLFVIREGGLVLDRLKELVRVQLAHVGFRRGVEHIHRRHGHDGGAAARRAGLSRHGVLGLVARADRNAGDVGNGLAVIDGDQADPVFNGAPGVEAVHSHGDARAHAVAGGLVAVLLAGGIAHHLEFLTVDGRQADRAVLHGDAGIFADRHVGIDERHLHGQRPGHAGVALVEAGFGLRDGLAAVADAGHGDAGAGGDLRALDGILLLFLVAVLVLDRPVALDFDAVVRDGHADGHGHAHAHVHVAAVRTFLKLALQLDDGVLVDAGRHFKVIPVLAVALQHDLRFSAAALDDGPAGAVLQAIAALGPDVDDDLLARVRAAAGALHDALVVGVRVGLDLRGLQRQRGVDLHALAGAAVVIAEGKYILFAVEDLPGVGHAEVGDLVARLLQLRRGRHGDLLAGIALAGGLAEHDALVGGIAGAGGALHLQRDVLLGIDRGDRHFGRVGVRQLGHGEHEVALLVPVRHIEGAALHRPQPIRPVIAVPADRDARGIVVARGLHGDLHPVAGLGAGAVDADRFGHIDLILGKRLAGGILRLFGLHHVVLVLGEHRDDVHDDALGQVQVRIGRVKIPHVRVFAGVALERRLVLLAVGAPGGVQAVRIGFGRAAFLRDFAVQLVALLRCHLEIILVVGGGMHVLVLCHRADGRYPVVVLRRQGVVADVDGVLHDVAGRALGIRGHGLIRVVQEHQRNLHRGAGYHRIVEQVGLVLDRPVVVDGQVLPVDRLLLGHPGTGEELVIQLGVVGHHDLHLRPVYIRIIGLERDDRAVRVRAFRLLHAALDLPGQRAGHLHRVLCAGHLVHLVRIGERGHDGRDRLVLGRRGGGAAQALLDGAAVGQDVVDGALRALHVQFAPGLDRRAGIDHGFAVVEHHAHGHRAAELRALGLRLVGFLDGKGGGHGQPLAAGNLLGDGIDEQALGVGGHGVRIDDRVARDARRSEAVADLQLRELVAFGGIRDKANLLAAVDGVQVFIIVIGQPGQDLAPGLRLDDLQRMVGVGLDVPVHLEIFVIGAVARAAQGVVEKHAQIVDVLELILADLRLLLRRSALSEGHDDLDVFVIHGEYVAALRVLLHLAIGIVILPRFQIAVPHLRDLVAVLGLGRHDGAQLVARGFSFLADRPTGVQLEGHVLPELDGCRRGALPGVLGVRLDHLHAVSARADLGEGLLDAVGRILAVAPPFHEFVGQSARAVRDGAPDRGDHAHDRGNHFVDDAHGGLRREGIRGGRLLLGRFGGRDGLDVGDGGGTHDHVAACFHVRALPDGGVHVLVDHVDGDKGVDRAGLRGFAEGGFGLIHDIALGLHLHAVARGDRAAAHLGLDLVDDDGGGDRRGKRGGDRAERAVVVHLDVALRVQQDVLGGGDFAVHDDRGVVDDDVGGDLRALLGHVDHVALIVKFGRVADGGLDQCVGHHAALVRGHCAVDLYGGAGNLQVQHIEPIGDEGEDLSALLDAAEHRDVVFRGDIRGMLDVDMGAVQHADHVLDRLLEIGVEAGRAVLVG